MSLTKLFSPEYQAGIKALLSNMQTIVKAPGPLSLEEAEYLAVETSKINDCKLCLKFHGPSYNKVKGTTKSFTPDKQTLLLRMATLLTKNPGTFKCMEEDFKKVGYNQAQYHHALFVVGLFNFSNRIFIPVEHKL